MANSHFTSFSDNLHSDWCYIADNLNSQQISMTDHNTNKREQRKSKLLPHRRQNIKIMQPLRDNTTGMFIGFL